MENPIIINVTCPPRNLWIGRESENNYRPQTIECAEWIEKYPNATIAAYYHPYAASDPYPLVLTADGTKRIWHPTATELVKGNGELQIVLMLGDVVGTSAIIPTRVDRSLISSADHPAEDAPSWTVQVVEDVTEQADKAEEAASHYPRIVNGVWYVWSVQDEDYVSTGIEAQGEDGYSPTVTVTEIEGGHRVTITDADGAHTFDVMDGDDGSGAVQSVNGKTGAVVLDADDVGALPDDTQIPSKVSDLTNDSGFVTAQQAAASAPVQSVNGETGAVVLDAADVHALPDSTVIPPTVTEQTVAGWGFTKNTGTYTKPSGGIPDSDIASAAVWNAKGTYSKPSGGIPASDLASAVQTSLGKADTAVQPSAISDMATETWVENKGYQTAPFEIEVTQSGSTYSTTASAADILAHQDNCVAVLYGTKVSLSAVTGNEYMAELFFANLAVNEGSGYTMAQQINISVNNGVVTVLADMMVLEDIPSVTSADDGKFLRVANGAWAAESVSFQTPRVAMTAQDTTPTLEANRLYVFPEMASLAITLATPTDNAIANEYHFIFTSGATATTLTIPASVRQPDGFTVDANHVYEVSILENCMTAQGWAVTV